MIYCLSRKKHVPATPEEKVRQGCLSHLVNVLSYPLSNIAIEKSLEDLPQFKTIETPVIKRRFDILVYKDGSPFLLIECKQGKLMPKHYEQLKGYNHYVCAPFIALATTSDLQTGYIKGGEWVWVRGFPSYYTQNTLI